MTGKQLNLEQIKQEELSILSFIDSLCRKHDIRYCLAYGTLLGAVRHQGFIPWDDDIDICMPRPDYERFLQIWDKEINNKKTSFKLFSPQTNEAYYYEYAKIISSNTICKINQPLEEIKGTGVWIDIFPLDGVPNYFFIHFWKLRILRGLRSLSVYTSVPKVNSIKSLCIYILWKTIKKIGWKFFQKRVISLSQHYKYNESNYVSVSVLAENIKHKYNKELFENTTEVTFEAKKFYSPKDYHSYLKTTYGDYMQLPSEEKRISNHSFEAYYK